MMLLQKIDRNELQYFLSQLDQALYNHNQWHNDIIRTIICRLPYDKHDVLPNSYEECRFGQWYYSNKVKSIIDHPGFIALGEAHKHMHQLVSGILLTLDANTFVTPLEYDNFANSLERLRLEIYALKNELEILLYNRDPLTLAINRVSMLPILREQQEITRRQFQSACIAMMDLDLFKKINDQYGHLVGDKILASLASYLMDHLRPFDKLFRYGGEEFLLFIQQVTVDQAYDLIDRLRKGIADFSFKIGLQDPIRITVSFGLTLLEPNLTVEQLIDRADKALFLAKAAGRNCTKKWEEVSSKSPDFSS